MQTPIYFDGRCFSNNIEILRDIADTIGTSNMDTTFILTLVRIRKKW